MDHKELEFRALATEYYCKTKRNRLPSNTKYKPVNKREGAPD